MICEGPVESSLQQSRQPLAHAACISLFTGNSLGRFPRPVALLSSLLYCGLICTYCVEPAGRLETPIASHQKGMLKVLTLSAHSSVVRLGASTPRVVLALSMSSNGAEQLLGRQPKTVVRLFLAL